ncbi:hypothetical protein Tco_0571091 [Tanacetum coccineum]
MFLRKKLDVYIAPGLLDQFQGVVPSTRSSKALVDSMMEKVLIGLVTQKMNMRNYDLWLVTVQAQTQREQLGDASYSNYIAYTQALMKVESTIVDLHKVNICIEEKDSQMSSREKAGLGTSETENSPVNDRYAEGMHDVPPPMTRIYIPSGPDKEIDDSQFTYGPKQSKPSESDARSSDFTSCESNTSEETHESMPETVVNEPNVVSQPKVWSDAPIIEEYESDSEDEHVSLPTKEQEIPSFAFINTVKHVKTPRQTVKE